MPSSLSIDQIRELPFFFIIGRPRSGTTLLLSLLDAHPAILIPIEFPLITSLYPAYGKKTRWTKNDLENFYNDLSELSFYNYYSFKDLPFNNELIQQRLALMEGDASFADLTRLVYASYESQVTKEQLCLLGDKNPTSSIQLDVLMKAFSQARYIHITRDYRDHALSMLKAGFGISSLALISYRWKKHFELVEHYRTKYPGQFFRIRYEDLVSNTMQEMNRIAHFLDISYSPELLEKQKMAEKENLYPGKLSAIYQQSLLKPITTGKVGMWHTNMSAKQVKIADTIVGKTAEKAGYSRSNKNFFLAPWIALFPYLVRRSLMKWIKLFMYLLPNKLRIRIQNRPSVFSDTP
jgi:hypothetical protein